MKIRFVKMHGCGNDYIYIDAINQPEIAGSIGSEEWSSLVPRMSDRHKGIGSDGVIAICPPSAAGARAGAHVRMRMFNADASEGEMCGNGVRCVAKFAHDRLGVGANPMLVETGRGVLSIAYELVDDRVTTATVDMGEPILEPAKIPVEGVDQRQPLIAAPLSKVLPDTIDAILHGQGIEDGLSNHLEPTCSCVSMGNPHLLLWGSVELENPQDQLIAAVGPWLEGHLMFPQRVNVHIVDPVSPGRARMLTWERGSGITQACGTGACAAVVAGVLEGKLERETTVEVLGGELHIHWDEQTDRVFMTGPAEDVFEGEWTC
jgi:diaminopimelate epimerase